MVPVVLDLDSRKDPHMSTRRRVAKFASLGGAAGLAASLLLMLPIAGQAGASGTVTLNPASGPYTDGQTITVSGTGFSTNPADSIEIVECADPNGTQANLPADNTTCDGTTQNPNTIFTNAAGTFSSSYTIQKLSTTTGNSINCDATHDCVLWVGEDFNGNFSGTAAQPVGFSVPFLVNNAGSGGTTPESPLTVALPIVGASVAGGAGFLVVRRRRRSAAA